MPNFKYKNYANLLSIVFIVAFISFVFIDVLIGTKSFFINFDNVEQFYPWYQKLNYSLHQGYFPLWDANTFGGRNFAGEFQTGIFYPINIIWVFLFGSKDAISVYSLDLLVVVHFCIAALGMYFVCREWKISYPASIVGGVLFAATGCVVARAGGQTAIFFGLALSPYPFLFTIRYFNRRRKFNLFLAGFFLGLQILAGHIQPFFHIALVTFGYIAFVIISGDSLKKRKEIAIIYLIITSVTIIVSFPQLFTGGVYMTHSYRWVNADSPVGPGQRVPFKTYAEHFSIQPTQLLNIIDRRDFVISDGNDLFVGLIPVLLALLIIYVSFKKETFKAFDENKIFFYWLMAATLIIMLGQYTYLPYILYQLPVVNTIRELGRYAILFHFSIVIVAAFGFEYITSRQFNFSYLQKKTAVIIWSVFSIETIYLLLVHQYTLAPKDVIWHLFFLMIIIAFIIFSSNIKFVKYAAFVAILFAIKMCGDYSENIIKGSSNYPTELFKSNSIIKYLEPKYGDGRVIIESDKMPENIGDVYKIQTKLGHDATMNKPYFDFIDQDWKLNSEVNDLLNIKYVITQDTLNLPLVMRDSALQLNLYERPTAYSRLFLKSFADKGVNNIPDIFTYTKIEYTDRYQKYETHIAKADTLIFSENYYPGWKIYIDSKRVDILKPRINNKRPLLMGVAIGAGKHEVELRYNCFTL